MARPRKLNSRYFRHANDLRNNLKIKEIRRQFGIEGYASLLMFFEVLASAKEHQLAFDTYCEDKELSLLANDFGVDFEHFKSVLDAAFDLGLIDIESSGINNVQTLYYSTFLTEIAE